MSKHRVFSSPYFPLVRLNTGKYGPEKTTYLDTFQAVYQIILVILLIVYCSNEKKI